MISLDGRKLIIPDKLLGYEGDHRITTVSFELPLFINNIDMSGFEFKLDSRFGSVKDRIILEKTVSEYINLSWLVEESHVRGKGTFEIQLRAFSGNDEKWASEPGFMCVGASIKTEQAHPTPLPTEFTQLEQRIEGKVVEAQGHAGAAQTAAETAQGHADTAENKAAEVMGAIDSLISCGNERPTRGLWMEVV